jgi:hypothetical protein
MKNFLLRKPLTVTAAPHAMTPLWKLSWGSLKFKCGSSLVQVSPPINGAIHTGPSQNKIPALPRVKLSIL